MLEITVSVNPCRYYMRGFCVRGTACRFEHVAVNTVWCPFFVGGGYCGNVDNCAFRNLEDIDPVSQPKPGTHQLSLSKLYLYLNWREEPTGRMSGR